MTSFLSRTTALLRASGCASRLLLRKRTLHSTCVLLDSLNGATAPLNPSTQSTRRAADDDNDDDDSGNNTTIQGEILDLAVDLRSVRPGDKLEIPYEITVTESMHDFWQSAFHSQDRIHTSRPFARRMGLQDKVLPFPLTLFLTSSMTHADAAKVQVGFGEVHYLWPAFAGDTFTKSFQVESVRNTSDGNHSIIHFTCDLINQRGRVCMRADKRLLFEFPLSQSSSSSNSSPIATEPHLFRDHLLSKASVLGDLGSHSLAPLRPGQLVLHSLHRTLTQSQSQQLASLARLTHERHFDTRKYDISEIMIPGGLVLGLTMSAASRDLHELLFEEITHAQYVNSLHPNNVMGAISYIQSVDENVPGDLECLQVRTIGIKNVDIRRELYGVELPLELFVGKKPLKPKELEHVCKTKCPKLSNKIVVQLDRKIIRQSPRQEIFLL